MDTNERVQSTMRRLPSWQVSLVPFGVLTLSLVVVIKIFGADALLGGSQVCLLLATAVYSGYFHVCLQSLMEQAGDVHFG